MPCREILFPDFPDCFRQADKILRMHIPDVPDTESVGLGDFARINYKAFQFELLIEIMEIENAMVRADDEEYQNLLQEAKEIFESYL